MVMAVFFISSADSFVSGKTALNKNGSDSVRVFKSPYDFKDFAVPVDSGKHASINWRSNPSENILKQQLRLE